VDARHVGIPGFDQKVFSTRRVALIGAGGLNGEIGEGLSRKGLAEIHVIDGDTVDCSNLNRQRFFEDDIGENKGIALAKNLAAEGFMGTRLIAYPFFFQEAVEFGYAFTNDLLICGVDNEDTRLYATRYGLVNRIPVIFTAVSRDGNQGYVFVQQPSAACYGCAFPDAVSRGVTPCPGVPAIKDILKVVAGFVLYAADTLLVKRRRNWNYRDIHLAGFMPDTARMIERHPDCPLCSMSRNLDNDVV